MFEPETQPPGPPICAARGCRQNAVFDLQWQNPKLHPPERRKHWLACSAHRDQLAEFLRVRGFLRDIVDFVAEDPS